MAEECAQPVRNREPLGGALEELNDLLPGTGTSVIRERIETDDSRGQARRHNVAFQAGEGPGDGLRQV